MKELTFRCDIGKKNYSQLNNKVNPFNTCNTTSMVMALDYMGYKLPDDIFKEYEQPEDKLTMLCLTDEEVLEFYKKVSPTMYNQWQEEMEKIKNKNHDLELKDYKFVDSYPPNEVHAVLSFATNKFVGCKDATTFKQDSTIKEISEELVNQKPVVVSVKFGNLNHVLTLTGIKIRKDEDDENWTPISYFADDTYGKFDMTTKTYNPRISGNDCEFSADDLVPCMKALGSEHKYAHFFKEAVAVI